MNKHYNKIFFQGKNNFTYRRYFEGWYYKQVTKDANYTISFIPGISYNKVDPHCFIQYIICNENKKLSSFYFKYDLSEFSYQNSPFSIQISQSTFRGKSININLENSQIKVKGTLTFENLEPLNVSLFNPNIMGFFSYIPKMECNHHIISMNHKVLGSLIINNKILDLNDGFGYMEKDWGKSFPSEYIWLQCNNFRDSKVKIAFSAANIPFLGIIFKGFFCSLLVNDKEYRFATYNRSKLKIKNAKVGKTNITLIKGNLELNILATVNEVQTLASPKDGVMNNSIKEGLAGKVSIILKDIKTGYELITTGENAGIEIMMEI
ncbi:MAG: tocopherol cyclase family protein [Sphaerochaetaceae bacterium]